MWKGMCSGKKRRNHQEVIALIINSGSTIGKEKRIGGGKEVAHSILGPWHFLVQQKDRQTIG